MKRLVLFSLCLLALPVLALAAPPNDAAPFYAHAFTDGAGFKLYDADGNLIAYFTETLDLEVTNQAKANALVASGTGSIGTSFSVGTSLSVGTHATFGGQVSSSAISSGTGAFSGNVSVDGKIGIEIASPAAKLDVLAKNDAIRSLHIHSTGAASSTADYLAKLEHYNASDTSLLLGLFGTVNSTTQYVLYVSNTGNAASPVGGSVVRMTSVNGSDSGDVLQIAHAGSGYGIYCTAKSYFSGDMLLGGATVASGTNVLTIGTGNTGISSGWYLYSTAAMKKNIRYADTGEPVPAEALVSSSTPILCTWQMDPEYERWPLEHFQDILDATGDVAITAQQQWQANEARIAQRNQSHFWTKQHTGFIAEMVPSQAQVTDVSGNVIGYDPNVLMALQIDRAEKKSKEKEARLAQLEREKIPAQEAKNANQDTKISNLEAKVGM